MKTVDEARVVLEDAITALPPSAAGTAVTDAAAEYFIAVAQDKIEIHPAAERPVRQVGHAR